MNVLAILLWIALLIGLGAATAALYGRYKVLPAFLTGPAVCQLEAGGCAVLFRTKRVALLGLPNAFFGILLYLFLIAGLILNWPRLILFVAATPALLMSIFLGYSLITNHLQCRICWAGHFANATIWSILLFKLFTQGWQ